MSSRFSIATEMAVFAAAISMFFSCEKEPVTQETPKPEETPALQEIIITSPSSGTLTLEQGENYRIKYDLVPEDADPDLSWSSSKETVASVKNGRVYAHTPGKTVITLTDGEIEAEVKVTVTEVQVTEFSVQSSVTVWMDLPDMPELEVQVMPEQLDAASLDWTSDHPEIAEVVLKDGRAFVKGKTPGSCILTASYEGLPPQSVNVSVYAVRTRLNYYSLSENRTVDVAEDAAIKWEDISPMDGEAGFDFYRGDSGPMDLTKVQVTSSDNDVISVSTAYFAHTKNSVRVIFRKGPEFGTASVSLAYEEDITAEYHFKIVNSPSSFAPDDQICNAETRKPLSGDGGILTMKGESFKVQIGADGVKTAIWNSSHPEVAEIVPANGNGLSICATITTKEWGETVISATDEAGTGTLSFKLKVSPPPFPSNAEIVPYFSGNWDPVTETYGEIRDYSWKDNQRNCFQVGYVTHDEFAVADRTTGKVYYAKWSYSVPGAARPASSDYVTYLKFDFLQPASGDIIATDGYGTELRLPAEIRASFKDRFLVRLNYDGTVDRNDLREAVQNKPFKFTWHQGDAGLTRTYRFAVCDAAGNMDAHFFNYANSTYGNVSYVGDGKKVIVEISFPGEHKSNKLYVYSDKNYTKCIREFQGE